MFYNNEIFISKAKEKHNEKYCYSKAAYVNSKTKIIIICQTHGEFEQKPVDHLQGSGCQKCNRTKKLTLEEFVAKANEKHNFKYDYSKLKFKNVNSKIEIICPIHGSFFQKACAHLLYNCAKCAGVGRYSLEEFIQKANIKHKPLKRVKILPDL